MLHLLVLISLILVSPAENAIGRPLKLSMANIQPKAPKADQSSKSPSLQIAVNRCPIPIGKIVQTGDLDVYQTGRENSKRVLISMYDIFGHTNNNTKHIADRMSKLGYLVAQPDFFRGKPWDFSKPPESHREELNEWLASVVPWDTVVKPQLTSILEYYKSKGATSFGMYGFCWGGKMVMLAGTQMAQDIKAVGSIHAAGINETDANGVKVPTILMPSKDEPDMVPLYIIMQRRLGRDAVEHYRFDDMKHGFASTAGDFKDFLVRTRVNQVLSRLRNFFEKHLK